MPGPCRKFRPATERGRARRPPAGHVPRAGQDADVRQRAGVQGDQAGVVTGGPPETAPSGGPGRAGPRRHRLLDP